MTVVFPPWKSYIPRKGDELITHERQGFWGERTAPAVAGQYSFVQLLNPAGSGVDVLIDHIDVRLSSNHWVRVTYYNIAQGGSMANGYNRYVGAGSSLSEIRHGSAAALIAYWWAKYYSYPTGPLFLPPTYLWLVPGKDITIMATNLNISLEVNFQWFEMVEF